MVSEGLQAEVDFCYKREYKIFAVSQSGFGGVWVILENPHGNKKRT